MSLPPLTLSNAASQTVPWATAVHENAKSKGWWESGLDSRSPGTVIFLMLTELAESFEAYRLPDKEASDIWLVDNKPEGLPVEIADAVIRCLDYCAALAPTCGGKQVIEVSIIDALEDAPQNFPEDFGDLMMALTKMLAGAYDSHFMEGSVARNRRRMIRGLLRAVVTMLAYSEHEKLDVARAIQMKHEYNATRPYRHGGKRA